MIILKLRFLEWKGKVSHFQNVNDIFKSPSSAAPSAVLKQM